MLCFFREGEKNEETIGALIDGSSWVSGTGLVNFPFKG